MRQSIFYIPFISDNEFVDVSESALPLVNATAESGELDNSLGNMDNQILGTRSPTRASILVSRPSIQNTCGVYPHTYLTNYHSQSIQEYRPFHADPNHIGT